MLIGNKEGNVKNEISQKTIIIISLVLGCFIYCGLAKHFANLNVFATKDWLLTYILGLSLCVFYSLFICVLPILLHSQPELTIICFVLNMLSISMIFFTLKTKKVIFLVASHLVMMINVVMICMVWAQIALI